MCSINGIVQFNESQLNDASSRLDHMLKVTKHRGPDGQFKIHKNGISLGVNRLAIVGLEDSSAVYYDSESNCYAIFNGEITNHVSLRQSLKSSEINRNDKSDGALILPLYKKLGWRFIDHLFGMFAIAIFDGNDQKLLLYRDRIGIKPLYYYFKDGIIVFSSEIKAIRVAIKDNSAPNFVCLDHILRLRFHPGRTTPFPLIYRVLPAELIEFKNTKEIHRHYWTLRSNSIDSGLNGNYSFKEFRNLFKNVIRENGASDVSGGFFVSGGLDSATVAVIGAQETTTYKTPISLSFSPHSANDEHFLKILKNQHLKPIEWVNISPSIAIETLKEVITYIDEPLENPIHIGTYLMAKRAKELGIKTVMTGDGADEFFLGYERHHALFANSSESLSKNYLSWIWNLTPDLVSELYTAEAIATQNEIYDAFENKCEFFQTFADVLDFERRERLPEYHCMRLDKMTMANGVEAKVPFLDHRIVEYSLLIPVNSHFSQLGKDWLRKAITSWLPKKLIQREKEHFPSMPDSWLSYNDAAFVKSILLDPGAKTKEWFRQKTIERWIDQMIKEKRKIGRTLWACLTLELWLSQPWVIGSFEDSLLAKT